MLKGAAEHAAAAAGVGFGGDEPEVSGLVPKGALSTVMLPGGDDKVKLAELRAQLARERAEAGGGGGGG